MSNEPITILIVDDQPSNLKFLARLLQQQGYRVRRAISGELALNAAFAAPPDLILLDILMPEMNGYEVCERLKTDRRTRNIPIIFVSVIDRADEKVRAFEAGGVDYITKPFQANEVLARINHQLIIRKLQQQLETQNTQLKAEIHQRSLAQKETQLLLDLNRSFANCPDFETALAETLCRVGETIGASYAEAWLEGGETFLQCARAWSGNPQAPEIPRVRPKQIDPRKGPGLIGRVWARCQPEWSSDPSDLSPEMFAESGIAWESSFEAVLAVPVTMANSADSPELNDRPRDKPKKVLAVLAFFQTTGERDRHWFELVVGIAAQLGTIVQQRQAEENRRISEEKFAKAFRSSPHAIALKTFPEGRYLDANESFFELLGYRPEEIIGSRAKDLEIWVHPQQRDRFQRQLEEQNGILRNLEVEFRTKSGQIKTLLLSAELIDLQGQTCVALVTNDISDRKQLEEEIAQQKRFLNAIIDYLPVGVFVKDVERELRYRIWNKVSEQVLGVPREELLDRNNWEVFPEDIARAWNEEDMQLLKAKQALVYPEQEINDPERKRKIWLQTTKAPIVNEAGEITHILGIFDDISDRQLAKIALRDSEKKYRDLVETSRDIIWSMDCQGCYTFVNPAMTRICGYEPEELFGRPFWDFIPPRERQTSTRKFLRVLQGDPLIQHEQKYLAKDGRLIYLQVNATAVRDESDRIIGVTGTATDITERKRVEEALRESVKREVAIATIIERMRRTLDMTMIFSVTTQELRRVLNCDRVVIYRFHPNWSGDVVAEDVGEEWKPLIHQNIEGLAATTASPYCAIETLNETLTLEDTYMQETRGGAYNRGTRYLCVEDIYQAGFAPCYVKLLETFQARAYLTVPIFTSVQGTDEEASRPALKLWGLLAAYQNSAPRHWQEKEINMAVQIGSQMGIALQQAELLARMQQQSEALKTAKEVADAANRAKSEFLASMSHELRTPLNAILGFTQLMARDDNLDADQQENLNIINRSGEHLLALINDVLEMSKIEAGRATFNEDSFNLHRLLDSLEEMLRLKADRKGIQLICDRDRHLPQYIRTDQQKLRQVLINLLGNGIKFTDTGFVALRVFISHQSFQSPVTSHRSPVNQSPVTSHQAVLKPEPESGFKKHCPEGSPVNQSSVVQPITNNQQPITNNQQPITNNQQPITNNQLYFEVEDTGCGIAAEEIEKVFEAFGQTTSGVRTAQGTGLGLPISQQFVCLMGGDLHLESEVGRGSKFFFEIPIVISEENMTESEIANRKPIRAIPPPDFPEDTYRILVVEDREYNGLLLFNLLTFLGFEVEIAENGVEAIALWQSWHPHLIWMDIQMPVMDGYEATRQIREQEEEREKSRESDSPPITHYPLPITEHRVPIIALTASAFVEDRQKALAAGCDDFLSKPFQEVELLAKMEEHLGLKYFYEEKNSSQNDSDPFDSASLLGDSRELGDDRPLKPSALQVMPEHWRQQLYEASLQCSDRLIQEAIAEIPEEYSNLEIALSHLIEDFRFDVVMELAKQSIE